jgi:hypothetical protein
LAFDWCDHQVKAMMGLWEVIYMESGKNPHVARSEHVPSFPLSPMLMDVMGRDGIAGAQYFAGLTGQQLEALATAVDEGLLDVPARGSCVYLKILAMMSRQPRNSSTRPSHCASTSL